MIIETKKEEVEIVQKLLVEEMMHAAELSAGLRFRLRIRSNSSSYSIFYSSPNKFR